MVETKVAPTTFDLKGNVKFNKSRTHRYELMITWKQPAKKLAMVITNYPGQSDGVVMDLTTMLVVNQVSALRFDGVVMVNLFSKLGLKGHPKELIEGADSVTDQVVLLVANDVTKIIIATGSFPKQNLLAAERQAEIIDGIKKAGFGKKLVFLCDSTGKLAHPLAAKVRKKWVIVEETTEAKK